MPGAEPANVGTPSIALTAVTRSRHGVNRTIANSIGTDLAPALGARNLVMRQPVSRALLRRSRVAWTQPRSYKVVLPQAAYGRVRVELVAQVEKPPAIIIVQQQRSQHFIRNAACQR